MKITVETGKWAARYVDERIVTLDMPEASTVADVIAAMNIPSDEAGLVVIDGKSVAKEYALANGDILTLHPIIVGG